MSRLTQFLARQFLRWKASLTHIRDTPHAIAVGAAIGLVCGFTPLWGFKTLLAVLLAWLFRCSKLSAVLAVTFHDILLPIWPVVLRWQYQAGFYLLSRPHRLPERFSFKHFSVENFFRVESLRVIWPTLVGSLLMSIPLSVGLYFLVLGVVRATQASEKKEI